jgi:hypothetical protein
LLDWYADVENGSAGTAVEFDQSIVPTDQLLRRGQAQSRAFWAARDERIKNRIL